jgi:DNA polymerase III subunit beta
MILELPPEILKEELSVVSKVLDKSSTLAAAGYVLIEPTGKHLRFVATDGQMTIESYQKITDDIKIKDPRPVCLPAKKLLDLAGLMSTDKPLSIEITPDNHASIKHGKSKFRLGGISADLFPDTSAEYGEAYILPGHTLKRFIKLTRGFIGEDDSRFAFSGGLLQMSGDVIRMVGTDGARLTVAEIEHDHRFQGMEDVSLLIPHKALVTLAGLIGYEENMPTAFVRNRTGDIVKVKFRVGTRFLTTSLTSGTFPAWESIVPADQKIVVQTSRVEFLASLKRALVVSDTRNRALQLSFTPNGVVIRTDGHDAGEDQIAAVYKHGGPMEEAIGINADFVAQFLSVVPEVLEDDAMNIAFSGPNQFISIWPESAEFDFKYFVAPVRI